MKPWLLKYIHWPLLIIIFILLVIISSLSEGFHGGADNINHYFISHFAFRYPYLFLDPWGRPVFTIMSSPFSQFGFNGIKVFNILCGCISAYLAYLIAGKIGIKRPWLVIVFVIFTPIYFLMNLTSLTEIQFGFILILSFYLFFDEKYILSAIVISFIPLSRAEGYAFLPFLMVALLMKKQYKAIPFLITGLVLFCTLGYFFVWKDFFWIFTKFPYVLHHPLYHRDGSLLHFITSSPEIFGYPLLVLFAGGLIYYVFLFFRVEKSKRLAVFIEMWLLPGAVLLFFSIHSYVFWKGLFTSVGLLRVITGVLPLAAIVSLKAYEYIEKTCFRNRIIRAVALFIVILLVIYSNFSTNKYPVPRYPTEQALYDAVNSIKKTPMEKQRIYYTDLSVPFFLNLDPYNFNQCVHIFTPDFFNAYPENSVVIWDSFFGSEEFNIPRSVFENSGIFRLKNIFRPKYAFDLYNSIPYEVCIFVKPAPGTHIDNKQIRDSIMGREYDSWHVRFLTGEMYEKKPDKPLNQRASYEVAHSGALSYKVPSFEQFTDFFEINLSKVTPRTRNVTIRVTGYVYPLIPFSENDTRLVVAMKDRSDLYHCILLDSVAKKVNQWNRVTYRATFPYVKSSDRVQVYFWHLGKKEFYIDDLKIEEIYP